MTKEEKETIKELSKLHSIWKKGKAPLKWWKEETGYNGVNLRKLCNIPLPHPRSDIQICCLYLMHIDYITQKICTPAILRHKTQVFKFLKKNIKKYKLRVRIEGLFPW